MRHRRRSLGVPAWRSAGHRGCGDKKKLRKRDREKEKCVQYPGECVQMDERPHRIIVIPSTPFVSTIKVVLGAGLVCTIQLVLGLLT
jgi:hypothetical protein